MAVEDYLRSKKLKKRPRKDGRIDVVGKDINNDEYTAITTDANEVTPRDIEALHRGDPERRDSKGFVDYFVDKKKENDSAYEAAVLKDYEDTIERDILPEAFKHSPRQCGIAAGPTSVTVGGWSHPKSRCFFIEQGGCDYCQ